MAVVDLESEHPPAPRAGLRILVVDDSDAIRRVVGRRLEEAGYEVAFAGSGEEAFEACIERVFDAVVSDVTMGALSGVQLCRMLRADPATTHVPVILLTASDDPRSRFWGRHAGAAAHVPKEAMRAELLPVLRVLLAGVEHREERPARRRAGSPLERLSETLERHLFDAVVAAEARRLLDYAHSREDLAAAVIALVADILDCAYVTFSMEGPRGPSEVALARGPWTDEVRAALQVNEDTPVHVIPDPRWERSAKHVGTPRQFDVTARGEILGHLRLFGGDKALAPSDLATAQLLAESLGAIVKSLFLMEETHSLAMTDSLTGLANRRHAMEFLQRELARTGRHGSATSIALCDVDHFKKVNDTLGHNVGDEVLRWVAKTLVGGLRTTDLVARWGGEEFLVLLPEASAMTARVVAERLRGRIEKGPMPDPRLERLTISIGVAFTEAAFDAEALVGKADEALYRAKNAGRNRVVVAD